MTEHQTDAAAGVAAPMRILHVSQPGDAGVARVVAGLARHQADAGHDVAVAGPGGSWLASELTGVVPYARWDADRSPARGVLRELRALRAIVGDARPDVVHLHSSKSGLVGRLALRGRVPTVFQPHAWSFSAMTGPLSRAAHLWERAAARWTDTIICLSAEELELGRDLAPERCTLVPNGVDLGTWQPRDRAQARARLGVAPDAPLVLCVGRLAQQKGQLPFAAPWRDVVARVPGATLALVGSGPQEAEVRTAYAGTEVLYDDACTDTRDWLAACDLVVAPSLWEGAALVPLEAMAMARGVVGYDVGGLADVLGEPGLAVPLGDSAALVDALVAALADGGLGARLRERVESRYDARTSYDRFTEVARKVARRRG